ncbi:unnamed protein product, partial [Didymodactylos carnosus]
NGRSIHDAEMASAKNALESHASMFPLLHYQKTVLEKKFVSSSSSPSSRSLYKCIIYVQRDTILKPQ